MTRHAAAASLLVLILGACRSSSDPAAGKPAARGDDTSAAAPAETASAEATAASAPEPAKSDAGPATGAADTAALQPAALVGQFGFDWLHPEKAKCVKLDDRLAKKLAGQNAACKRRPAEESFDGQSGEWVSCRAGEVEWLVYASKKVCQEQLETMQANAP